MYRIVRIVESLGSEQESTSVFLLVDLFDEVFGNEMLLLLQLSIILESFNSFHVLHVLATPRPANCNSLMEVGQSSTFEISSRFPEACLKRQNSCVLKYFGVLHLVLSKRKLTCEQFSSPFSLTTFTTQSSSVDCYIMMA